MLKKKIAILIFFLSFNLNGQQYPILSDLPISQGEELKYRIKYSWFTMGYGDFYTFPNLVDCPESSDKCLRVQLKGKTGGIAGIFSKIDDEWSTLVRVKNFLPVKGYMSLKEGGYRAQQFTYFDFNSNRIRLEEYNFEAKQRETKYLEIKNKPLYDVISGYFYARSIDYSKFSKQDTLTFFAYLDKEFYTLKIVYHGIVDDIKTKFGQFRCHKIKPVMPDNAIFRGENSISIYITDDENRLPILVQAKLFIGSAECLLISYKNIKSQTKKELR